MVRYDAAVERKSKILDIIRSLDLPNNPLDDIIDQVIELSTWEHWIPFFYQNFVKYLNAEQ